MSDPILPLAVWEEGTLQNDVPANDNSLRVEAMSREVLGVANSPVVSTDGTVYIVGAAPTGAFATFDTDDLTIYYGGTWYAWAPVDGVVVNLSGSLYAYNGGWAAVGGGGGGAVASVNGQTGAVVLELGDLDDVNAPSPSDGQVLTWDSGTSEWVPETPAGGGGITGFTATLETASPNNTINASRLLASGGTTNQDAVFSPKGTGAIQGSLADGTSAGGNKRGPTAVDWQTSRSNAARVASGYGAVVGGGDNNGCSGTYSTVAGGYNNNVTGDGAACAGYGNTVSGNNASVFGRSNTANNDNTVALGNGNTASGSGACAIGSSNVASGTDALATGFACVASAPNSQAQGQFSTTTNISGMAAYASGRFDNHGDAQEGKYVLRSDTTGATPEALTTTNSSPAATNQITPQNNSTFAFDGIVVARSSTEWKTWRISGGINRGANAASTAVGTTGATVTAMDGTSGASAWAIAVTADTTNGCLKIEATGAAATNIKWVAAVKTAEVVG